MKRLYYFQLLLWASYTVAAPEIRSFDPPGDCPLSSFPQWNVTSYVWWNGSKSLHCGLEEGQSFAFCPDTGGPPESCPRRPMVEPFNTVGLPSYQPLRWTPSPSLTMAVEDGESCATTPDSNYPMAIGRIGHGQVNCGYMVSRAGFELYLWGTTNEATSVANIAYSPQGNWYAAGKKLSQTIHTYNISTITNRPYLP